MSFGDAIGSIAQYAEEAARLDQPGFAVTDHGHLFGLVDAVTTTGVKVIPGCELYVIDPQEEKRHGTSHLTVIAKSSKGLRQLLALLSRSQTEHYYYHGRTPLDELSSLTECFIFSGCRFGYCAKPLLERGDARESRRRLDHLRAMFGDRFFAELQAHDDAAQLTWNTFLRTYGTQHILTNDVHYPKRDHVLAQQVVVGGRASRRETTESPPTQLWLKSAQRMYRDMRQQGFTDAEVVRFMERTVDVAEGCVVRLTSNDYRVPSPDNALQRIEHVIQHSALLRKRRYRERVREELAIIRAKGFAGFFWLLHEIVTWARSRGMYVSNRGSAVSSLVLHLLGVTTIDPLMYDLPVFRFISLTRDEPPDVDIDVERARRDELMTHIFSTYGEEHVAPLANIGRYKPYLLMNDIVRAWEKGYIPDFGSCTPTMKSLLREIAENKREWPKTPQMRKIREIYDLLEDRARYVSVHAGGLVFSARPIWHSTHLYRMNNQHVAAIDKFMAEKIGMMKLDVLIVDTLDILRQAVVKRERDALFNQPPTDPQVYRWLRHHPYDLAGIFQLSDKGRDAVQQIQPRTFNDLMVATTVIRPGSSGLQEYIQGGVTVPERFKKYLVRTRGVVLYQEQIMQLVMDVGFTPHEADYLMKLNKKRENQKTYRSDYARLRRKWIAGCVRHHIPVNDAARLWGYLTEYGFNLGHACGYAYLTYLTAWAKSRYYLRFMCALLNYEKNEAKERQIVRELLRSGVRLLPPHVNESKVQHCVVPGAKAIRIGLGSIKFVGHAAEQIVKHAPFTKKTWEQFQQRHTRLINKRVVDALMAANALENILP
jgi:DNA polymerase-3 subunit alpha